MYMANPKYPTEAERLRSRKNHRAPPAAGIPGGEGCELLHFGISYRGIRDGSELRGKIPYSVEI